MSTTTAGHAGADILRVLGVSSAARSGTGPIEDLRAAVRRGLPFSMFEALLKEVDLPQKQLSAVLGITDRTIARRREERHLTPAESDRVYRVARTVAHAEAVLGGMDRARSWLKSPNRSLGNETPLALLDTEIGARQVEESLLRIDHGIYS